MVKFKKLILIIVLFLSINKTFGVMCTFDGTWVLPSKINTCSNENNWLINIGWRTTCELNVDHFIVGYTSDPNWSFYWQIGVEVTATHQCFSEVVYNVIQSSDYLVSGTTYYYKIIVVGNGGGTETKYVDGTFRMPGPPICVDWQYMTNPTYVDMTTTTPNNSDSYVWHEESNIMQGVHLNLMPGEERDVVLEQNNHIINFTILNASSATDNTNPLISHIEVNIDNQGDTTIFDATSNGSPVAGFLWNASSSYFNDVGGQHTIHIKWIDATTLNVWDNYFDIYVIPASKHLYKDNYCNSLRVWEGEDPNSEIPMLLSEGFDPYNMKQMQFYYIASEGIVSCMLTKGFKAYYLNYTYGGQDIRNNAAVFASAVKYISSINNNQKIVASGVSMGGVIARYAFAKAEGQGNPLPASKFITFDSPHQGAVLSQPLQVFRKESIQDKGGDPFEDYSVSNIAAEELLTYNAYDPSGNIHTTFYNELNSLNGDGYPHQTVNIGVSFSNQNPNPNSGTWFTVACSQNCTWANTQLPKSFDLQDNEKQAGSYLPTFLTDMGSITQLLPAFKQEPELNWMMEFAPIASTAIGILISVACPICGAGFISVTTPFLLNNNYPTITMTRSSEPCYIPYVSALDEPYIGGPSKFVTTGLPGSQIITPVLTYHHDVMPNEPDFINKIVNALLNDNTYLQNKDITDTRIYIAGQNIIAGNNVNPDPSIPTGDFIVESGANVTFKAGQSIELKPGFDTKIGSEFYAYITSPVVTCDDVFNENQLKNYDIIPDTVKEIQAINPHKFNFIIYPNPTTGIFILSYSDDSLTFSAEVSDFLSRSIFTANSINGTIQFDLSSNPKGIYIVKTITSQGNVYVGEIVYQ